MRRRASRARRATDRPHYRAVLGVAASPRKAARAAGLVHVTDAAEGIRRLRTGRGFRYLAPTGLVVSDGSVLSRLRRLAIPPAWTDVWICDDPVGHIQATGRDARGRKQYRYHPLWRAVRDAAKYGRLLAFSRALPLIRARVEKDLARQGLPRDKVVAAVVRLLEATLIRVGNEEYARDNGSFGLTTLRTRHASISGSRVDFRFRGKSGKRHDVGIDDGRLSRIVKRCQELPGQVLFQYLDGRGRRRSLSSDDVNRYLRAITGEDFTAKDFRTWSGTLLAARTLKDCEAKDERVARRNVTRAIETVAQRLGNTATISRKCYVHPAVIESYLDGTLTKALRQRAERPPASPFALRPEEISVLAVLRRRLLRGSVAGSGPRAAVS